MARVEDQYMDVLQNIETAISDTYRDRPDLTDYDVMRVLEALVDDYRGEKIGRPPRPVNLSDRERLLADTMRPMCEWRLGRGPRAAEPDVPQPPPITPDEIILCLKRLLKSVKFWNKDGGRQGYLSFISQYV